MEITLYPEGEEKKQIRQRYAKTAVIVMISTLIFQAVPRILFIIIGLAEGASLQDSFDAGRVIIASDEVLSTLISIGFPIIADITAILLGAKLLGINFKSKKVWSRDGYNLKDITDGAAVTFFCQTAAVVILAVIYLLFTGDSSNAASATITQTSNFAVNVVMYFYICLLGPVMEEMIFRGIVLESIRPYNEKFAVVFSSLIFGLMHGNLPQCINGFLAGLVLGVLYAKTRSLIPSAAVHILMNTVTSVFQVMIYSEPDILDRLMENDLSALTGLPVAGMMINGLLRIVTFFAGIVVIAMTAGKGFGLRRAKPEGKKRAAPLIFTSIPWLAAIAGYIVIIAINI